MAVPKVLTSWDVSIDGIGFVGVADSFKPPKLEEKIEEVWGCGHSCAHRIPVGFEAMSCEISLLEITPLVYQLFGFRGSVGVIILTASLRSDEEKTTPLQMVLNGRFSKIELDSFEMGKIPKQMITMDVRRMAMTIDNQPAVIFDSENNILNLHDIGDRLADIRKNLIGA